MDAFDADTVDWVEVGDPPYLKYVDYNVHYVYTDVDGNIEVDFDFEKCFDNVNHDRLMGRLAKDVNDRRVLRLTRAFLNAGAMEKGLVVSTGEGTPQGGPLSPLLSNIVLDELDKELERRGHKFVRYADDCNIFVRSERAGHRVMRGIGRFIEERLKLKVNAEKSAVGRPWNRKFLGFTFYKTRSGAIRINISQSSIERFKVKLREETKRRGHLSLKQTIEKLNRFLRGWRNYYGLCELQRTLLSLDSWIRRRLRCRWWVQLKRGKKRYKAFRKLGLSDLEAQEGSGSAHGPWRMSRTPSIHKALSILYFRNLGLLELKSA